MFAVWVINRIFVIVTVTFGFGNKKRGLRRVGAYFWFFLPGLCIRKRLYFMHGSTCQGFFQLGAEAEHGLAVHLGNARLRIAQHLADFLHREFVLIIERNGQFFLVRQIGDGVGDELPDLG